MSLEKLFTIKEAAEYFSMTRHYVGKRIRSGELPAVRLGLNRDVRIRESDLAAFIASRVLPDKRPHNKS